MSLHLRRQNKQKMGGGKACVNTGIWYSDPLVQLCPELPDPRPKTILITKTCQTLFVDPETKEPGTNSVYTAKPSFPPKPSGLINLASWEPFTSSSAYKTIWKCASCQE